MDKKIISLSTKRQLTIPQKYYEALGFTSNVECILRNDGILIKPLKEVNGGEFSEEILADLITQGYEGQELFEKFKEQSKKIRPAVLKMIDEADKLAKSEDGRVSIQELFHTEE